MKHLKLTKKETAGVRSALEAGIPGASGDELAGMESALMKLNRTMKKCRECRKTKPIEEFHMSSVNRDGYANTCAACRRSYHSSRAAEIKASRVANSEREAATRKRYEERNKEKILARAAVRDAVKSGKLYKPDRCEDCGELTASLDLHSHHEDYAKRLEVQWYCRSCHGRRHQRVAPDRAKVAQ